MRSLKTKKSDQKIVCILLIIVFSQALTQMCSQMLLQIDPHNIRDGRKLLSVMNESLESRLISQKNPSVTLNSQLYIIPHLKKKVLKCILLFDFFNTGSKLNVRIFAPTQIIEC